MATNELKIDALELEFRQLSQNLSRTANLLQEGGVPPTDVVIRDAEATRRSFLECSELIGYLAEDEQIESPSPLETLSDLVELSTRVRKSIALRAERDKLRLTRQRAGKVLERASKIVHGADTEFAAVRDLRAKARALEEETLLANDERPTAELLQVAEGHHAICDLLVFIENKDIDDLRWEQLLHGLSQSLGKDLAIAAARGRLLLASPAAASKRSTVAARSVRRAHANEDEVSFTSDEKTTAVAVAEEENADSDGVTDHDDESIFFGTVKNPLGDTMYAPQSLNFRRALPNDVHLRSPLTFQQEAALLGTGSGACVLFGSRIGGLDDVEQFLQLACQSGRLISLDVMLDLSAFLLEVDDILADRPEGIINIVVPHFCPWNTKWVQNALDRIEMRTTDKKVARVLFMADPKVAWEWVSMDDHMLKRFQERGVKEYSLQPWDDTVLKNWMEEVGFGPDEELQQEYSRVTGKWGELIHRVALKCKCSPGACQVHLNSFEHEMVTREEWRERLGLTPEAAPILKAMLECNGPTSWDDILGVTDSVSPIELARVLRWAEKLGYVRPLGRLQWHLDPVVRLILSQDI